MVLSTSTAWSVIASQKAKSLGGTHARKERRLLSRQCAGVCSNSQPSPKFSKASLAQSRKYLMFSALVKPPTRSNQRGCTNQCRVTLASILWLQEGAGDGVSPACMVTQPCTSMSQWQAAGNQRARPLGEGPWVPAEAARDRLAAEKPCARAHAAATSRAGACWSAPNARAKTQRRDNSMPVGCSLAGPCHGCRLQEFREQALGDGPMCGRAAGTCSHHRMHDLLDISNAAHGIGQAAGSGRSDAPFCS